MELAGEVAPAPVKAMGGPWKRGRTWGTMATDTTAAAQGGTEPASEVAAARVRATERGCALGRRQPGSAAPVG